MSEVSPVRMKLTKSDLPAIFGNYLDDFVAYQ